MGILGWLSSWFGTNRDGHEDAADDTDAFDVEQFIYVRIPGHIEPIERGDIEDRIEPALDELGEISGGGSLLGDPRPDGSRPIEFCGIDIDTTDRDAVLTVLRGLLPTLGMPAGTELQYTCAGARLRDIHDGSGWSVRQPRTELHPGFGI